MKRIVYGILATISGLVLLFSYRTSLGETVTEPAPAPATVAPTTAAAPAPSASANDTASAAPPTSTSAADGTFTGQAVNTRYGSVQVQIVVSGGQITSVTVPEYPNSNPRDSQINQRAIPQLVSETLSAQSNSIDMVSGATYTSDGYIQSLQSAIDQAGL